MAGLRHSRMLPNRIFQSLETAHSFEYLRRNIEFSCPKNVFNGSERMIVMWIQQKTWQRIPKRCDLCRKAKVMKQLTVVFFPVPRADLGASRKIREQITFTVTLGRSQNKAPAA